MYIHVRGSGIITNTDFLSFTLAIIINKAYNIY